MQFVKYVVSILIINSVETGVKLLSGAKPEITPSVPSVSLLLETLLELSERRVSRIQFPKLDSNRLALTGISNFFWTAGRCS